MKKYLVLLSFVLLFACNNSKLQDGDTVGRTEQDTTKLDTVVEIEVSEPDSLDLYFEEPLDFYYLKKNTEHMHSGGNVGLLNEYFYDNEDSTYVYYDYWAIEFHRLFEDDPKPICFKVLKPWATSEDRYYGNDNEILLGIKSCISWDGLQQSDFVGVQESKIVSKFGQPDTIVSGCYIYSRDQKFLSLKINDQKVVWFKYFWLNYSFEDNSEIHNEFVNW